MHIYGKPMLRDFFPSRKNTKLDMIVSALRGTYSLEDGFMHKFTKG